MTLLYHFGNSWQKWKVLLQPLAFSDFKDLLLQKYCFYLFKRLSTASICGFSWDPLIFSECLGYLNKYYNVILFILIFFISRSTYLFMCTVFSDCTKTNSSQLVRYALFYLKVPTVWVDHCKVKNSFNTWNYYLSPGTRERDTSNAGGTGGKQGGQNHFF